MEQTNLNREIKLQQTEELGEKYKTALKKMQFINELKGGLGDEIKKNPSKVKIIKEPFTKRLMKTLKKIFTSF